MKIFIRFDWDFVFSALQKFGYRDKVIHMIKAKYTNIHPKIKTNVLLLPPLLLYEEFNS